MTQKYTFYPRGVCSQRFDMEVDEQGTLVRFSAYGGCAGNLEGIARLITGLDVRDVIEKLEGVTCGPRPTSCPDQIARACKELLVCTNPQRTHIKD